MVNPEKWINKIAQLWFCLVSGVFVGFFSLVDLVLVGWFGFACFVYLFGALFACFLLMKEFNYLTFWKTSMPLFFLFLSCPYPSSSPFVEKETQKENITKMSE